MQIQARTDAGPPGDRTNWVEDQTDRDLEKLKVVVFKKLDDQQALIQLKIELGSFNKVL